MSTSVGSLTIDMAMNILRLQKDVDAARGIVERGMSAISNAAGVAGKALGFLGIGLSAAAFSSYIAGVYNTAEGLHDLAISSGMAVEGLSGLAAVGKYTNRSADDIAKSAQVLAKNLAGATEESKGAGKALEALGISFDTFKKMKADEQFLAIAKAMDKYGDTQGKVAVAQALWGKQGAANLPMMKDLAATGDLVAKVTSAQADMADHYNDNLTRLHATSEAWKKQLAMSLLPALDLVLQAYLDVTNGANGMKKTIADLAKDGTLATWAKEAVVYASYVIDGFQGVNVAVQTTGKMIAASVASTMEFFGSFGDAHRKALTLNLTGAFEAMRAGVAQQKAIWGGLGSDLDSMWSAQTFGQKLRDRMTELEKIGVVGEKTKPSLDFTNIMDKNKDAIAAAKKAMEEFLHLRDKLNGATIGLDPDFQKNIRLLMEQGLKAKVPLEEIVRLQTQYIMQQPFVQKQLKQYLELVAQEEQYEKEVTDARTQAYISLERMRVARSETNQLMVDQNAELELESKMMYASAKDRKLALEYLRIEIQLRKDLITISKNGNNQFDIDQAKATAAEARRLAEMRANQEEQFAFWESLDKTAHDVWTNIWQGGTNIWKKLKDTAKASFFDWLYQMVIKKWVINIAANITGQGGVGSQMLSSAMGGGNGIMGTLMNSAGSWAMNTFAPAGGMIDSVMGLFGAGSGIGGAAIGGAEIAGTVASTAEALAGLGATASESAAAAAALGESMVAAGGTVSGALGGISTALAAIPVWGWIAMAVIAIVGSGVFDGKGGPKTEGGYIPESLGGTIGSAFGNEDTFTSNRLNRGNTAGAKQVSDSISASLDRMGQALGITIAKTVGVFWAMDNAEEGDSLTQLQVVSDHYNRSTRAGGIENVARGEEELQKALVAETAHVLLAELAFAAAQEASKVPKTIADMLKDSATLGDEAAQKLVDSISAIIQSVNAFGAAAAQWPIEQIKSLSFDMTASLIEMMGGLQNSLTLQSGYIDAFYTTEEKRAQTVKNINSTLAAAGLNVDVSSMDRMGLRSLVEAQDLTTESGRRAYAALMQVSSAFASITPAIEDSTVALKEAQEALEAMRQKSKDFQQQVLQMTADAIVAQVTKAEQRVGTARSRVREMADQEAARLSASQGPWFQAMEDLKKARMSYATTGRSAADTTAITKAALQAADPRNASDLAADAINAAKTSSKTQMEYLLSVAATRETLKDKEREALDQANLIASQINALTTLTESIDKLNGVMTFAEAQAELRDAEYALQVARYNQIVNLTLLHGGTISPERSDELWNQYVPSYDVGSSWIPHAGPAMLHPGEAVLTRSENADRLNNDSAVLGELVKLNTRLERVEDENKRMRLVLEGSAKGITPLQTTGA